ncbi:acyltransferase [Gleimia sp. 6138-11-ORH1]|uniref:acyltransferase family protein n=1 Tax=Gleimia sp. 6138-11-ORH1 TaxID=2973937 RepID=UPI0021682151|nr:acyltransferase family protein [Gleimia sp. 6138-11-ORH1]MCS4483970.1 acyltransferase [Gleimia sp. 6138-11-ORH1]
MANPPSPSSSPTHFTAIPKPVANPASETTQIETTAETKPATIRPIRGLDGLRALAALAVLAYHLFPGWSGGGFLGVDVFFVLSGFLITSLLLSEQTRRGKISLKRFWVRRVRRLFPAAFLMAIVTIIVAGIINMDLLARIVPQFFGVVTFSYNWVEIYQGASYFDNANPHLWTNVWSLAVEQQFYLIWPLITILILRLNRRYQWGIPFLLAVISAGLMAFYINGASDFTRAYQGTDSHAFGLMLGASFAFIAKTPLLDKAPAVPSQRWVRGSLAWLGLVIMVLSFYYIPDNQAWVYPLGTLISVFATLLVIQGFLPEIDGASGPGQLLANLLSIAPLRWLGERSYGIYLWHWPIWVIAVNQFPRFNAYLVGAAVLFLSILVAALSYTWVEEPMRRQGIAATIRSWLGDPAALITPNNQTLADNRPFSLGKALAPALVMIVVAGAVIGFLLSAPDKTSAQKVVEAGQQNKQSSKPFTLLRPDAKPPLYIPLPQWQALEPIEIIGENIYVLGDSVTVASTPALEAGFPGIIVDAAVSRHMYQASEILYQTQAQGRLKPYVVVALATNSEATEEQLETILQQIGRERRLILVNGFGPDRISWIANSNRAIEDFAAKNPSRVRVADWAQAISEHTDYLATDFIHPSPAGGEIFTKVVREAMESFNK